MLKSTSTKIFVLFGSLAILQLSVVGFLFGRLVVRETETFLLDALSRRSQLTAAQIEKSLLSNPSLDEVSTQNGAVVLTKSGQLFGTLPEAFAPDALARLAGVGQSIVTQCQSLSGEKFHCAITSLPTANAWTIDTVPAVSAWQIISRLSREMLGVALSILAIILCLTFFLVRWILRPLSQFVDASQYVAQGSYDRILLPTHRPDEIGSLARSFSHMIVQLKEREKKVAHSARLASMGQMGASIAHEVKNPLMAMSGHAKILLRTATDTTSKEAAEIIAKESDRCSQILNQMLKFTRNDSTESKPYALKEVIQATLGLAQAEAKRHQIELTFVSQADPIIVGHAQQVQQVILNLVVNAIQASREALMLDRPAAHQVEIRLSATDETALVEVMDHAMGIADNLRERVFEPFFTTKDKREGTGLGLSVALDLVTDQGGTLTFSTSKQGTVFEIRLPLTASA